MAQHAWTVALRHPGAAARRDRLSPGDRSSVQDDRAAASKAWLGKCLAWRTSPAARSPAMTFIEEQLPATNARLKMRDLARRCGWLDAVLSHQDRLLERVEALDRERDAPSRARQALALEEAVRRHFRVEQDVLAPAIQALGLRAQVVVAETCRDRLRRDLADLRSPPARDDPDRVQDLGRGLASHFLQQERCAYRALARCHDDCAADELARRCLALLAGPDA
jgi:hypothetical protein